MTPKMQNAQRKPRVGLHLDSSNVSSNNQGCHLYVRVRLDGKYLFFSTNVFVLPEHWDAKKKCLRHIKGHANSYAKERRIQELILQMNTCIDQFYLAGRYIEEKLLREAWGQEAKDRLIDFCQAVIAKQTGYLTKGTLRLYRNLISKIKMFSPDIRLVAITGNWLEDFQEFLLTRGSRLFETDGTNKGLAKNTVRTYFTLLKRVIRLALRQKLIGQNPFEEFEFKLRIPRRQIQFLSQAEIHHLYEAYINEDLLKPRKYESGISIPEGHRKSFHNLLQMYLISVFSGLRYSDVCQLDDCIQGDYIYLTMKKTSQPIRLRIGKRLRSVLNNDPDHMSHLNDKPYTCSYANTRLRKLLSLLGIKRYLSFHSARHTFATTLLSEGTDLKTVSRLLGHSSLAMTELYTHITDRRKDEAILKMDQIGLEDQDETSVANQILRLLKDHPEIPQPSQQWVEALRNTRSKMKVVS